MDVQHWRRQKKARDLEWELFRMSGDMYEATREGKRRVTNRFVKAVMKPSEVLTKEEREAAPGIGGIYKRMQRAASIAGINCGDWLWTWVAAGQRDETLTCEANRTHKGETKENWRAELWRQESEVAKQEEYNRAVDKVHRAIEAQREGNPFNVCLRRPIQDRTRQTPMFQGGLGSCMLDWAIWELTLTRGARVEGYLPENMDEWDHDEWEYMREVAGRHDLEEKLDWIRGEVEEMMAVMRAPPRGETVIVHWCCGWGSGVTTAVEKIKEECGDYGPWPSGWNGVIEMSERVKLVNVDKDIDRLRIAGGAQVHLDVLKIGVDWLLPKVAVEAVCTVADMARGAHWAGPECTTMSHADRLRNRVPRLLVGEWMQAVGRGKAQIAQLLEKKKSLTNAKEGVWL